MKGSKRPATEFVAFWSWILSLCSCSVAPFYCDKLLMRSLHAAISKSGTATGQGQLDLLILETNRLHGAVSLRMPFIYIFPEPSVI
jgi:hypothetical protein